MLLLSESLIAQNLGCTDFAALNYNPSATINDGSCIYESTTIVVDSSKLLPNSLSESSGLIKEGDFLISHNDDETDTFLYKFNLNTPSTFTSSSFNLPLDDWEEIQQDEHYYYFGDIGNNISGNRTNLRIYKINKNLYNNNAVLEVDTIRFSYELQTDYSAAATNTSNFDCEAFIVIDNEIFLFTKEWTNQSTSVYKIPAIAGNYIAEYQSSWNCQGLITGATKIKEKQLIVLSGYNIYLQPFVVLLYDFNGTDVLGGNKRMLKINLPFHQIEGICSEDGIHYFLTNEKLSNGGNTIPAKLHYVNLSTYLSHYLDNLNLPTIKQQVQIQITPNPARSEFILHWIDYNPLEKYFFELRSLDGKNALKGTLNGETTKIPLTNLVEGQYLLTIYNQFKHVAHTQKVNIQR